MPPRATKEQIFPFLWNNGFFDGFALIRDKFDPDDRDAHEFKKHLYGLLLKEVVEAKNEAGRLLQVLARMEAQCRSGSNGAGDGRYGNDTISSALKQDVKALDGWVISLFESNITLLHYIWNIETAGNRSNTLHQAMREVIEKRKRELGLFVSDPSLFKLEIK